MATQNSSFPSFNNHNSNTVNINNNLFSDVLVTKLGNSNLETINTTTTTTTKQQVVEGLTEILFSSYQRKRSISNNNSSSAVFNQNSNLLSSPFMDDLGFLSTATSNTINSTSSMKKNALVVYNEDEEVNENFFLMSSPMKIKEIPMKSCSIRKHWNHHAKVIQPRRSMSETFINSSNNSTVVSENGLIHHLPCFDSPHDAIKRISPETLINLLEGKYSGIYEKMFIIDCRYPYEYEGGHIPSAINVNCPEVIEKLLMEEPKRNTSTLIVFHCEFSSERAPRMALHVRNLDRQLNKTNYPSLYYPEMYILDGGYKNYWQQNGGKCDPPHAYLPMRNPQYRDQLRHHQKLKHAFKSGCHLSQHSNIKTLPPKSKKTRSKSLNIANARKFFNDLISGEGCKNLDTSDNEFISATATIEEGECTSTVNTSQNHMFPSYTIPMTNSFSSIFASELDIPSEMDLD